MNSQSENFNFFKILIFFHPLTSNILFIFYHIDNLYQFLKIVYAFIYLILFVHEIKCLHICGPNVKNLFYFYNRIYKKYLVYL